MREDRRRVRSQSPRSGAQKGAAVEVHHPSRGGREGRRGRGRRAGIRRERGGGVDDGGAGESGGASGVGRRRRRFGSAGCWRRFGSAGCSRAPPEPDQGCEDTRGPDARSHASEDATVEPHAGIHGGRARVVSTDGGRVVSTGGRVGDDVVDRSRRGRGRRAGGVLGGARRQTRRAERRVHRDVRRRRPRPSRRGGECHGYRGRRSNASPARGNGARAGRRAEGRAQAEADPADEPGKIRRQSPREVARRFRRQRRPRPLL